MRGLLREAKWNHSVLIITVALTAWVPSAMSRTPASSGGMTSPSISGSSDGPLDIPNGLSPDDAEARVFLEEWLSAHGFGCPDFEVSAVGVPHGADAATFCTGKSCVIRIRPESLHAPIANARIQGNARRQWQNLLLHEAVHYIDILRRGRSDHGTEFRKLARGLGVVYQP